MDEDEFIDGYLETALWSSTDDDGEPLDGEFDTSDFDDETLLEMEGDARDFFNANENALEEDGWDSSRGGHNFWLTRNGHGAGFWDGDYPKRGDELTANAKPYGTYDLYVGDDGKVHGGSF